MKRCFLTTAALLSCAAFAQTTPEVPQAPSQTISESTRVLPQEVPLGRQFPLRTQRGVLEVVQFPEVTLNGKPARLSPGSRVRDAQNRIVFAHNLAGQKLLVNFTQEISSGMLQDVWVLTEAEAKQKLPSVLAAEAAKAANAVTNTN